MGEQQVVVTGLIMGESARWHDGRFWFCDWVAGEIIRLDGESPTVVGRMSGLPFCIDWLPDGTLLVLDGPGARLLRADPSPSPTPSLADGDGAETVAASGAVPSPDGPADEGDPGSTGAVLADLGGIDGVHPWNDIAADSRGNVFVNNIGYDFPGGEPAPGLIAVVTPGGTPARQVADGLLFPNGMAVTPDDATLIVAESHGGRLTAFDIAADGGLSRRRVWAELPGAAPDGICVAADGTVWYADVPNRCCVRIREGGEVLATVTFDRGAFDCAVSADGQTLYTVTADYSNPQMFTSRTGQVVATPLSRA
jgi:sugar lactone lactonase YvrE